MNRISALIKETSECSCTFQNVRTQQTVSRLQSRGRLLPVPDHAGILILNIKPPELWEINVCCLLATQSMVVFYSNLRASQMALVVKKLPGNTGDVRNSALSPGSWGSPGGGHGKPLQYSCLENSVDRRAWWAIVRRVAKRHNWSDLVCMHKDTSEIYKTIYINVYIKSFNFQVFYYIKRFGLLITQNYFYINI